MFDSWRAALGMVGRPVRIGIAVAVLLIIVAGTLGAWLDQRRQDAEQARQECDKRNRVGALVNAEQGNPPSWFQPEDCR